MCSPPLPLAGAFPDEEYLQPEGYLFNPRGIHLTLRVGCFEESICPMGELTQQFQLGEYSE